MLPIIWSMMIKRIIRWSFSDGAWMNWLPPIACILYTAVSIGCLSRLLRFLYLAAFLEPNGDQVRIGYFGLCVKTKAETNNSWTCSRFLKPTNHLFQLTQPIKSLQHSALWPLPSVASVLLFVLWIAMMVFRKRSCKGRRWMMRFLWLSCAIGFAGALIPLALGSAFVFASPVYGSEVVARISVLNDVVTWFAFGFHAAYVGAVVWWDRKAGNGKFEMA